MQNVDTWTMTGTAQGMLLKEKEKLQGQ